MIAYEALGPNAAGDYMIAYATPGAPHVITVAGTARTKQGAEQECVRLNEESRQADIAIKADMLARNRIEAGHP